VYFPFALAARWILAMASFSSSCMVPVRIGCPMLFPRSKGPTNRTSIPGTLAMASTYDPNGSASSHQSLDRIGYAHSPKHPLSLSVQWSPENHLPVVSTRSGLALQTSPLETAIQSLWCPLVGIWQIERASWHHRQCIKGGR